MCVKILPCLVHSLKLIWFLMPTVRHNWQSEGSYAKSWQCEPRTEVSAHGNDCFCLQVLWAAKSLKIHTLPNSDEQHVVVSYLPLSHIAAQVSDIYLAVYFGGKVCFAQPDALKGSLVVTLCEAQPTLFFGVPRYVLLIREQSRKQLCRNLSLVPILFSVSSMNYSLIINCVVWNKKALFSMNIKFRLPNPVGNVPHKTSQRSLTAWT